MIAFLTALRNKRVCGHGCVIQSNAQSITHMEGDNVF